VKKFDFALQLAVKLLRRIVPALSHEFLYYYDLMYFYLERYLRNVQADELLAVDIPALSVTQRVFGKCHFFSLELYPGDPFREKVNVSNILSVIIQNRERYDYLFPGVQLPVFYIQNAPVFKEEMIRSYPRKDLIWAGTIVRQFAVIDCIEFIRNYPSYHLVLKGGAERKTLRHINEHYRELIQTERIIVDRGYLASGDFIDYLAHFKIGICFYGWETIRKSINYQTAPSGKLFMYMAAGVPVVACNIPGFRFIAEFRAGVLIDDYRPETILTAVQQIEQDYDNFSQACYAVARHFSFDKDVRPFIDFISCHPL
jgi:glycosyltransferase involved in cell wall biosynthesis